MNFATLWSKEKEDDCYFKSEKLVHSYLENEKNGSQQFLKLKKLFHSYFVPENFRNYL